MIQLRWPDFFIVGTARAGTTSLYNYFSKVPEIYMSPVKIPNFFTYDRRGIKDEKSYLDLFKDANEQQIIGEASGYLSFPESAKLIHEKIPHGKIIISLRDPVERAFSHYLQSLRGGYETLPFKEAFQKNMRPINEKSKFYQHFIKLGFYHDSVKRFLDLFGGNQIKIIIFEEFTDDIKKTLTDLLSFLGIETKLPENIDEVYNAYTEPIGKFGTSIVKNRPIKKIAKSILPRSTSVSLLRTLLRKKGTKPEVPKNERLFLEELYHPDVIKLENLLGRSLPWSLIKKNSS